MQFLLLCVEISSRAATTNQSVSILVQSLHAFLPKLFFYVLCFGLKETVTWNWTEKEEAG